MDGALHTIAYGPATLFPGYGLVMAKRFIFLSNGAFLAKASLAIARRLC
jgi:hypothetical protein